MIILLEIFVPLQFEPSCSNCRILCHSDLRMLDKTAKEQNKRENAINTKVKQIGFDFSFTASLQLA